MKIFTNSKTAIGLFLIMSSLINSAKAEIEISQSLDGLSEAEKAWLMDDSNLDAFAISEGELKMSPKASKKEYWLENHLSVTPTSIQDGWMKFSQCHHQLDPVAKIEVSYNADNTRSLKLKSSQGIENIKVHPHSVELQNVTRGAMVCINGESKTLFNNGKDFVIKRGPYMRKFLDGYYPMIVEENIFLQGVDAQLIESSPLTIESAQSASKIHEYCYRYAFEGKLQPNYTFKLND